MGKRGGTPSRRDTFVTVAAISLPGVVRGRSAGGHQSGTAGFKPPPLFMRKTSSCTVTGAMPGGAMGRLSTTECTHPAYLNNSQGKGGSIVAPCEWVNVVCSML